VYFGTLAFKSRLLQSETASSPQSARHLEVGADRTVCRHTAAIGTACLTMTVTQLQSNDCTLHLNRAAMPQNLLVGLVAAAPCGIIVLNTTFWNPYVEL
jgi:hypothetical protein